MNDAFKKLAIKQYEVLVYPPTRYPTYSEFTAA